MVDRGARSNIRQRRALQRLLSAGGGAAGDGLTIDAGDGSLAVEAVAPITSGASGVGITLGAGVQNLAGAAALDIDGLTEETTPADDDTIAIFDESQGAVNKMSRANFLGAALPAGAVAMYLGSSAPTGWLLCNGDTIGDVSSGAVHESADLEALFDLVKNVLPNAGTEVFASGDTVALPDFDTAIPIGVSSTAAAIDALGETAGSWDHTHNTDPPLRTSAGPSTTVLVDENSFGDSEIAVEAADDTHTHGINLPSTESDAANPPVLAVHFIVKI